MKDLKVDGANVAAQFQYNAANQVKTMTLGNGAVETFSYDTQTGLLTGQTLTGAGQSLLNLTYGYNGAGAYASVKTLLPLQKWIYVAASKVCFYGKGRSISFASI